LSEAEFKDYIHSQEWQGKAGGYSIQGSAESFVIKIVGSYSNVVGLPLYETRNMLRGSGYIL
jgi:septum formation protein